MGGGGGGLDEKKIIGWGGGSEIIGVPPPMYFKWNSPYRETCAPASSEHVQSWTFGLLVEAILLKLTGWFHIYLF